jgi:transmembrane sensor
MTIPRFDDLPYDALARYFAGELADREAEALRRWMDADPERRQLVERLREVWAQARALRQSWNAEAALRRIKTMEPESARAAPSFPWALRIAAAIAILAGGLVVWHVVLGGRGKQEAPAEVATRRGQRATLRFPDGTVVVLGPASTLRYAAEVRRRPRTVDLDGEAYFTVTHDAKRPFAVRTAHGVARDLGTRFVVRAYRTDSVAAVVVAEGSVSLAAGVAGDSLVLAAGDLGRVTAGGHLATERGVSLEPYLGWTEGRLVFQRTPLREAAVQFGRWYGVDVRLGDAWLGEEQVTASFRDEPAATALGLVAVAAGLVVEERGTEFILRRRAQ